MTFGKGIGEVDLHGLRPEEAFRRLSHALHTGRVRGVSRLTVITGRGWGNDGQQPILRGRVETWLRGPEGRRAGVLGFRVVARGGALELRLG
jgi:DNA-nicking Smr family endonuclease